MELSSWVNLAHHSKINLYTSFLSLSFIIRYRNLLVGINLLFSSYFASYQFFFCTKFIAHNFCRWRKCSLLTINKQTITRVIQCNQTSCIQHSGWWWWWKRLPHFMTCIIIRWSKYYKWKIPTYKQPYKYTHTRINVYIIYAELIGLMKANNFSNEL